MGIWRSATVAPDEEPAMSHTPGAKALRIAIDATAEAESLKRRLELLHSFVLGAQSLRDRALYDYSVAKQRNPYSTELAPALVDALLDIDRRLEQGLVSAGLPPTRDGGKT